MNLSKIAIACALASFSALSFSATVDPQTAPVDISNASVANLQASYVYNTAPSTASDGTIRDSYAPAKTYYLWSTKRAPGAMNSQAKEEVIQRAKSGELSDRIYVHTTDPKMAMYFPEPDKSNGIGLILFPGGALERTVIDKEGEVLGPIFSKLGFTVGIVNYRLPYDGHDEGLNAPFADAQRAVRMMRYMKDQLGINSVGVMGFSSGGTVAANLSNRYDQEFYKKFDAIDNLSAKPDFTALIYSAALLYDADWNLIEEGVKDERLANELKYFYSAAKEVKEDNPPTFFIHAANDDVVPDNDSLVMYEALKAKHVPVEMHIFAEGGHGFGVRAVKDLPALIWPELFNNWVQSLNLNATEQK